MENYEKYSKLIPLGGLLIVFFSSIKLVIFYNFFNIEIVNYIGIGEYATLFVDDLLSYLGMFGLGILLNLIFYNDSKTLKTNFSKYKKTRNHILIMGVIVFIIFTITLILIEDTVQKLNFFKVGVFIIFILVYIYFTLTKYEFSYIVMIIFTIGFYSFMDSIIKAKDITENNPKLNYIFEYKEKRIETDSITRYLGKTEKFIYLFNVKENKSIIISNSNLEKIKIKEIKRD